MSAMFWAWLIVIVITAVLEFLTMEVVSIWFTIGAIVPFILSAMDVISWEWQLLIFILLSAILIISLRKITKKFLLRNSNEKTNLDAIIGKQFRMLSKTDFETLGTLKINDVVWSAIGENQEEIKEGEIVEVLNVSGNKLIVKKIVTDEPKKEQSSLVSEEDKEKNETKTTKKVSTSTQKKNIDQKSEVKPTSKTTTKSKTNTNKSQNKENK